jgi:hypothetical protein
MNRLQNSDQNPGPGRHAKSEVPLLRAWLRHFSGAILPNLVVTILLTFIFTEVERQTLRNAI